MNKIVIANKREIWRHIDTKEWLVQLCGVVVSFNTNHSDLGEKLIVFLNGNLIPDHLSAYEDEIVLDVLDPEFEFPTVDIRYLTPDNSFSIRVSEKNLKETTRRFVQGWDADINISGIDEAIKEIGLSKEVVGVTYEKLEIPLPENETLRDILWTIFNFYDQVEIMQAEWDHPNKTKLKDLRNPTIEDKIHLMSGGWKEPIKRLDLVKVIQKPKDLKDFWIVSSQKCPIFAVKMQDKEFLAYEENKEHTFERAGSSMLMEIEYSFDEDGSIIVSSVNSVFTEETKMHTLWKKQRLS